MNTLTIKRYNGDEIYNIKDLSLSFTKMEGIDYLKIEFSTDKVVQSMEDTEVLKALPNGEILLKVDSLDEILLENQEFSLEESYNADLEEHLAMFYYVEHQDLDNNEVTVFALGDNKYKVVWNATTTDVRFYDGSKPDSTIIIEAEGTLS